MPVNLCPPEADALHPVKGVRLGVAKAAIRKKDRFDLLLVELAENSQVAAVFTSNRFCAAPVQVAKEHLTAEPGVRALLVNTGCANAGTGRSGVQRSLDSCTALANLLQCSPKAVLPFSTGVIMESLPVDRIISALPQCIDGLDERKWLEAAVAIMTTDSVPKALSKKILINGHCVTITGMAKGSGMIKPDMATMLAFVATDAAISRELLGKICSCAAEQTFNAVTVDGDTSTNDSFVLIATGQATLPSIETADCAAYKAMLEAVTEVCMCLAQSLVRDGEGASKFIAIKIEGGVNEAECRKVAYSIAHSPLVKTAFYASDPNLGRILAAIGNSGIPDLDVGRISVFLDDVLVACEGGRAPDYQEADGKRIMKKDEITVRVVLNRGSCQSTVWTCDLSHQYVSINADYRS